MITNKYSFEFNYVQFSPMLCFTVSINKVQGQTMQVERIDNIDPCLTHSQFLAPMWHKKNLYVYTSGHKTVYR